MRILCISDVHGYAGALSAVLAAAERRAWTKLLVAGDLVFPGPQPLETWRRLVSAGATMVQGVTDKAIVTLDPDAITAQTEHERARLDRMRAVRAELGDVILERIRRLPTSVRVPLEDGRELVLVHGSPADPAEAMSHDMTDEELLALVGDDPADVVVCGMSHVPFDRTVSDVRIVNVGSVGEAPDGAVGAFAHAAFIESSPSGIVVEPITVPIAPEPSLLRHG